MLPLRNLMRRKLRSLFCLTQIAVAIAAFVAIVGVTAGLRAQFYSLSQVFAYDIMVQARGASSPMFSRVTPEEVAAIAQVEGVKAVSQMGFYVTLAKGRPQPITFLALEPGGDLLTRYRILKGRSLQPGDGHKVLIGKLMAEQDGLELGDQLVLGYDGDQACEIVGIFEPPVEGVAFLAGQAIMSMEHYEGFYNLKPQLAVAHTELGGRASSPAEVKRAHARCKEVIPGIEAAVPRQRARTILEFLDSFKQAETIDSFIWAISLLAALVSGIGVANTMLMSVFDRTREIGLLRAIGWSRLRIVGMIQGEGILLAVGGGLLGLPLGYLLIFLSRFLIQHGWLQVSLDPVLYLMAFGFALFVGVAGSIYPAIRAALLPPTEALRYE
ncbi:MAG: ABC transporter permease [Planctomycetes bacterium]|nr:ABC transporter permease [Planctomycetota bacterium]